MEDLTSIQFKDNFFDVIYCISVLEHIPHFEKAIYEIQKILKPNGLFILTFDISLDNYTDIPISRVNSLLNILKENFKTYYNFDIELIDYIENKDILTTKFFLSKDKKHLLPWKFSFRYVLSIFRKLLFLKRPQKLFRLLTIYCVALIKK